MLDRTQSAPPVQALSMGRLQQTLGFLIRIAQLQLYDDFFEALPDVGMRPGEFSVLALIGDNPGQRQGQLAEVLRIRQPHMTKLVRRLEGKGLVERRVPVEDRRSVELHLTPAGQVELVRRWQLVDGIESRRTQLSQAEEAELKRLLRKLTGLKQ